MGGTEMSTTKPETLLVKKITAYLDTVPKCCYEKRHGSMYAEAGQPDISACINGRRVEIEVKVPSAAAIKRAEHFVYHPMWPFFARIISGDIPATPKERGSFPGNAPTSLQIERLSAWERAGAVAFVAYSVDAVREVVEKLERGEIK